MEQKSSLPIAVVIVPTYNEAGNINRLIDCLFSDIFPKITNWQMKLLVVDSNSPDGTSEIVNEKAKTYLNLSLFVEYDKRGLGAAYIQGFSYAIDKLNADVVFEFDADFQHPPELIPLMLKKIDESYDYVVGSRKIKNGGESKDRNILRSFLTSFGSFLARLILFFPGKYFHIVTDPTTGLKATRVKGFLDRIPLHVDHLYSKKFGYKLQLFAETLSLGAKYVEIPLQFGNRQAGKSKIEMTTMIEVLLACLKTRYHLGVVR